MTTHSVLGLWPKARIRESMSDPSFGFVEMLTRNIEYTPATHIPSLPAQGERQIGEAKVLGNTPEGSHGWWKES